MEKIKKVLSPMVIIIFLSQNAAFCHPDINSTLRPPSQFSESAKDFINNQNTEDLCYRYKKSSGKEIRNYELYNAITGIFGINVGSNKLRAEIAENVITAIYASKDREEIINDIIPFLEAYSATPSGEHRFTPLVLAVVNNFRRLNVFDKNTALEISSSDPRLNYLREIYPLYANPARVDVSKVPDYIPSLDLPALPTRTTYRWLDFGSAPKITDAPTLNLLRDVFNKLLPGKKVEITGIDRLFPMFKLNEDGTIEPFKDYKFDSNGNSQFEGVTYLDARFPQHDVMSNTFEVGKYDFISLCRTLHHLKAEGEELVETAIADVDFVDDNGRPFSPQYWLYPSQKIVINNLLHSLNTEGILFIEVVPVGLTEDLNIWRKANVNADLFVVIERLGDNKFKIYDSAIPFRPDARMFSSREIFWGERKDTIWHNPGIVNAFPNHDQVFYGKIGKFFDWADIIAYRFQKRDHSVWIRLMDAVDVLRRNGSLSEIFIAYLIDVPEEYKKDILKAVEEFSKIKQKLPTEVPRRDI